MSKINVVQMVEFIVESWGFYTTLGDCVGTTDDSRRGVKEDGAMTQNVLHAQSFGTLLATCSEGFAGTCRESVF
jgi:hypothetical protein